MLRHPLHPPLGHSERNAVFRNGWWAPNGSFAPTKQSTTKFAVSRTSTGLYRVTLNDQYPRMLEISANVAMNGARWVAYVNQVSTDLTNNFWFDVMTATAAAPDTLADPGAGAGHFIFWRATFSGSSKA